MQLPSLEPKVLDRSGCVSRRNCFPINLLFESSWKQPLNFLRAKHVFSFVEHKPFLASFGEAAGIRMPAVGIRQLKVSLWKRGKRAASPCDGHHHPSTRHRRKSLAAPHPPSPFLHFGSCTQLNRPWLQGFFEKKKNGV